MSKRVTRLGWFREDAARASCRNRARLAGVPGQFGRQEFESHFPRQFGILQPAILLQCRRRRAGMQSHIVPLAGRQENDQRSSPPHRAPMLPVRAHPESLRSSHNRGAAHSPAPTGPGRCRRRVAKIRSPRGFHLQGGFGKRLYLSISLHVHGFRSGVPRPFCAVQLRVEPGLGSFPVSHDGVGREVRSAGLFRLCSFRRSSASPRRGFAAGSSLASSVKASSRATNSAARDMESGGSIVKRDNHGVRAALLAHPRPCCIHEDSAHLLARNGKEMGAVLPLRALLRHQLHIRFVDQSRGLQHMPFRFAVHVPASDTLQFCIHKRNQPFESGLIATAPGGQQFCDILPVRAVQSAPKTPS